MHNYTHVYRIDISLYRFAIINKSCQKRIITTKSIIIMYKEEVIVSTDIHRNLDILQSVSVSRLTPRGMDAVLDTSALIRSVLKKNMYTWLVTLTVPVCINISMCIEEERRNTSASIHILSIDVADKNCHTNVVNSAIKRPSRNQFSCLAIESTAVYILDLPLCMHNELG